MKNACFMSLRDKQPHEFGAADDCLACRMKRREDASQAEGAVSYGFQRPAVTRTSSEVRA